MKKFFSEIYWFFVCLWNKLANDYVYYLRNPYKIKPEGNCPVQAFGVIINEEEFDKKYWYYFRSRGSQWYLKISDQCDKNGEFDFKYETFSYGERNFRTWPGAGWISKRLAIQLATKAIKEFYKSNDATKNG